jgi:hypothetical protein
VCPFDSGSSLGSIGFGNFFLKKNSASRRLSADRIYLLQNISGDFLSCVAGFSRRLGTSIRV